MVFCIPDFDCNERDLKTGSTTMRSIWIRKVVEAAAKFDVPVVGDNVQPSYHKSSFDEILKM